MDWLTGIQVYTGVANQGFMQPQTLASQDIVITTYETLRRELNYVNLPHTNSKYMYTLRIMVTALCPCPSSRFCNVWLRGC